MTPPPRLLLITDPEVCPELERGITAAVTGGGGHVLLRAPGRSARWLWEMGERLLAIVGTERLLIHDRVDLALALGAVGVHLPEHGMPVTLARRLLGPDRLLGTSCHDAPGAVQALAAGADYVTLSPVFPTRSHPGATPLGLPAFQALCQQIPGPVLALGGVTADNARQALANGAQGVALIRGILDQPDPGRAMKRLLQVMKNLPNVLLTP